MYLTVSMLECRDQYLGEDDLLIPTLLCWKDAQREVGSVKRSKTILITPRKKVPFFADG